MVIFNGKKAAEKILLEVKEKLSKEKIEPALAVISAGQDSSSNLFIKNKKKHAKRIGIKVIHHKFEETASEEEIIKRIEELNNDRVVNGIIVQLPLPKKFNTEAIIEKINPKKDIDGFHRLNRELLKKGKNPYFCPPLSSAVLLALKDAIKDFKGKQILAVVNSKIFGETLKNFLKKEGIKTNFVLKKKHHFLDIRIKLKSADVIITACGCLKQLKGEMIKEGAILIDAGISVLFNGKVAGDIDRKSVTNKAAFLTPVPGGIGPLTVALLLKNAYLAAKNMPRNTVSAVPPLSG